MNRKQRRRQQAKVMAKAKTKSAKSRLGDLHTAFQSAKALRQAGKLGEAERLYRRVIEAQPDNWEAHNNLGNVLADLGDFDRAAASLQRAVALNPGYALGHNNLGTVLREQGRLDQAVAAYRRALAIDPDLSGAHFNLGTALRDQNKPDQAVASYRRAAELGHQAAAHMLALLTGVTPESAPQEYVVGLFDQSASGFDSRLVEGLAYNVPMLLRAEVEKAGPTGRRFANVVDLGCGTGLSGAEFRGLSDRLTGVDLSRAMLDRAKEKNVFDALIQRDIVTFLSSTTETYDLFVATDVMIYVGDLNNLFLCVRKVASKNALFAFSTESVEGVDYNLNDTGRYAHSRRYIEFLSRKYGFLTRICKSETIRKESGRPVDGDLYILEYQGL